MLAIVFGAGGFIGSHMVKRLKSEGYYVVGADLKYPEFSSTLADDFFICDLSIFENVNNIISKYDVQELYQFAADMGGAGYVFTGENDANIMLSSSLINLNTLKSIIENKKTCKIFYSSSACIYPKHNQENPTSPDCRESTAYPANPDSEYGWEKIFSERLYQSFNRNYGVDIAIARYHNIFGPEGTWTGGKEKSPAAICRKVIQSNGEIEVWGDGTQTRSFLYIDDCIEGTRRLMKSNYTLPVNIGSEEMVTINDLVDKVAQIAGKTINKEYNLSAPKGVAGRNSNNDLIYSVLKWKPESELIDGLRKTFAWIQSQC